MTKPKPKGVQTPKRTKPKPVRIFNDERTLLNCIPTKLTGDRLARAIRYAEERLDLWFQRRK